jgi:hypothetical protein
MRPLASRLVLALSTELPVQGLDAEHDGQIVASGALDE